MLVRLAVVLGVATFAGLEIVHAVDSGAVQQAADWCSAHNGTLQNANVIGEHGGLHCELPNGTVVHMSEVPDS